MWDFGGNLIYSRLPPKFFLDTSNQAIINVDTVNNVISRIRHIFNHPHTGEKYKIKGIISCQTKNVIYMLKCPCGLVYVGKTTKAFKTRIAEHTVDVRYVLMI